MLKLYAEVKLNGERLAVESSSTEEKLRHKILGVMRITCRVLKITGVQSATFEAVLDAAEPNWQGKKKHRFESKWETGEAEQGTLHTGVLEWV